MRQVYVHGLGQTAADWDSVLRQLGRAAGRVCPDLAGMLPSGEVTYPRLYSAFARLCDGLEAPLALCGLSLGGVLSLHYTAEHPGRVGALALIAPQYRMPKRLLQIQNILFRFMPQSMFRETGFSKSQFIKLCGSMRDLDLSEALADISCPALVLCGSRDRANRRASAELAQLLPGAEFRIVEGSGHEVNRDAPEQLALLLRAFFLRTQGQFLPQKGEAPVNRGSDRRFHHVHV